MEYQNILADIQQLAEQTQSDELTRIKPVLIQYQEVRPLTTHLAVIHQLRNSSIQCGWITWPDRVECIESGGRLTLDHTIAPLEAELLLDNGNSLRLNYRNGVWNWLEITVSWPECPAKANAIADIISYASREKGQAALTYARIWENLPQTGMTTTDAIFIGFAEDKA